MLDRANKIAASRQQDAAQQDSGAEPALPSEPAVPLRHPRTWSREEAFLRRAQWCGLSRRPWRQSEWGGSDVQRPLNAYAADLAGGTTQKGCTKHQRSNMKLVPGCMLYWCTDCGRCVGFSVMDRAESVRVPFEFLYTGSEIAPAKFQMDNVCNADQYFRNREPAFFAGTEMLIDQAHFAGHVTCSENYNTGVAPLPECCILSDSRR